MSNKLETKEKICLFYASDYHFEMIALPYTCKSLEENKDVIILTENNLNDTMKILLSKMNFKDDKKETILNLDWESNDLKKFKKIKKDIESNKNMVIFIKGKENYIKNANQNLEKWISKMGNLKVIDCYDIEEVTDKANDIINNYDKILKTSGEMDLK